MLYLRQLLLVLLLVSTAAFAKTEPADGGLVGALEFTPSQVQTTLAMLEKLGAKHYAGKPLDDELSKELLENYLDTLDPGRLYFLASDIANFQRWRLTLDDSLRQGNLEPGFDIFNLYQKRVVERLQKTIDLLEKGVDFDFNVDESLDFGDDDNKKPWASTTAELDESWRKRLKDAYLRLLLAEKPDSEIPGILIKRYKNTLKRIEQSDSEDAYQYYMNALASLYDPHTSYYSPRQLENFNISMSLKLEGIGAVLQLEDETTSVVRIIPGGPADKQGILAPEDKIVGVGQGEEPIEDVIGWRLDDVVDQIRGDKGTTVKLEIIPAKGEHAGTHQVISIVRDEVKLEEQAAKSRILNLERDGRPYKVGVIDLPAFYIDFDAFNKKDPTFKSTTKDVARLLAELQQEQVDGIILDLRNNGGGSLYEVTKMTDLFINPGPVVQIRKDNQISRGYRSKSDPRYTGPLVVLINRLSASASEIFAGAIQDYGRGLVVGTRSFGKGTVQSLVPLHEGQVKLTESKFYRVSGDSTQHRGVVPDIDFPSLYDMDEVGESAREHALPWDQIHPVPISRHGNPTADVEHLRALHAQRVQQDPDFQFVAGEIALAQNRRGKTAVELNMNARKQEQDSYEKALFELENQRRIAKHQEPYATVKDWKAADDEKSESEEDADVHEIPLEDDPFLKEAGLILIDRIGLTETPVMNVVEH
jgi:carboxyl-terminal processing protease